MLRLLFSTIFLLLWALVTNAQYITVTENFTDQQLIQKIFSNNSCLTPSNIKINGYTFTDERAKSYGYFTNSNPAFKLKEGIIITTGKAKAAVGPNNRILSDGPKNWAGDQDLEVAINERNTYNATSIEFEIDAVSSQFSFDYILSSEQYLSNPASYQCNYSDGFAFLIKEVGNPRAQYKNIALVPDTDIPVKIPTIRGATRNCPESFPEYFGGFNGTNHPTNYNGQTVVLTAKANVVPGKKYKFKLVIADQGNELYDSAIFLSAGSFKNSIDLGVPSNVKLCQNESLLVTPTLLPAAKYYTWYKNGIAISNFERVANPTIEFTEAGTYKLEAYIDANCIITETITISLKPEVTIANETHTICQFSEKRPFNIIKNNNLGFNTNTNDYLSFHYTREDALSGTRAIPRATLENFIAPIGTTILYTRGYDFIADCSATGTYTIINLSTTKALPEQSICNYNGEYFDLSTFLPYTAATNLYVFDNINNADNLSNSINQTNTAKVILKPGDNTLYILYKDSSGCGEKFILKINVLVPDLPSENIDLCEDESIQINGLNGFVSYLWNTGETTKDITVTTEGTYVLKVISATGCEFNKKYIVTKKLKAAYFNHEIEICSFNTNNEKQISVRNYIEKFITKGNTFAVFATTTDLNQNTNPTDTVTLTNSSKKFFVKEITNAGCETISEVTFAVNFADILTTELLCQINNQPIDISFLINDVKNTYKKQTIKIYTNYTDAEEGKNELTNNFITQEVKNIYIRILDDKSCLQSLIIPLKIDSVFDLPNELKTICKNEQILLSAPAGNYSYLWNTGETSNEIFITKVGQYTVTITNANGCSFTKTFIVNQSQPAQIKDVIIKQFANIENSVTILVSGTADFEYSLDGINYQKSNVFTLVKAGEYIVYVKDPKGCGVTTKPILVLDIPNFFTPNGDGINDTWNVANLYRVFPDAEIYIIDRFGKLLTYLYRNNPQWDGTAFGQPQPSTDYWYVIKLNNGNTYKGNFSLKR